MTKSEDVQPFGGAPGEQTPGGNTGGAGAPAHRPRASPGWQWPSGRRPDSAPTGGRWRPHTVASLPPRLPQCPNPRLPPQDPQPPWSLHTPSLSLPLSHSFGIYPCTHFSKGSTWGYQCPWAQREWLPTDVPDWETQEDQETHRRMRRGEEAISGPKVFCLWLDAQNRKDELL